MFFYAPDTPFQSYPNLEGHKIADAEIWNRLELKGLEGQFLWELQYGYELSPRLSEGILELVKLLFSQDVDFKLGRIQVWVIAQGEAAGKSVKDLKKVPVWVTLDAGPEDLEIYRKYGAVYLRRMRILRVTEQIVDSGGLANQEDLGRLFHVDVRTICLGSAIIGLLGGKNKVVIFSA